MEWIFFLIHFVCLLSTNYYSMDYFLASNFHPYCMFVVVVVVVVVVLT